MILRAPRAGTLEWRVDPRRPGCLAWLAAHEHCALLPIELPEGATPTWTRPPELATVSAGEPLALLGDDATEHAECLASVHAAALSLERQLRDELDALEQRPPSRLGQTLLEPERRRLTERLARVQSLTRR